LPAQPGTELLPTCSIVVSGNRSAINATTRAAASVARRFHGRNAG
jgi:homoaconitase/3-isopropylmalate dehydratase large subunit